MKHSLGLHTKFSCQEIHKENYLTKTDVRLKLLVTLSSISMVVASQQCLFPLTILFFSSVILYSIKVSYSSVIKKLLAPFFIVLFLVLIQPFIVEGHEVFRVNFFNLFLLKASIEGIRQGLLISSKVLSSVSVFLCLIYTTSMDKLILTAFWLKIPSVLVDISLLMYRYIFLFTSEASTIFHAQKLRFGYATFRNSLHSIAVLSGMVFIRAFDQASITQQAMNIRLYRGNFKLSKLKPISLRETFVSSLIVSLILFTFWKQSKW